MDSISTIAQVYIMVIYCTGVCPSWLAIPPMEGFLTRKACEEKKAKTSMFDSVRVFSPDGNTAIVTMRQDCKQVNLNGP